MEDSRTTYDQHYEHLKTAIELLEEDCLKAAKGNKSAGSRVRKSLRLIKQMSAEFVKFSLSESKNS